MVLLTAGQVSAGVGVPVVVVLALVPVAPARLPVVGVCWVASVVVSAASAVPSVFPAVLPVTIVPPALVFVVSVPRPRVGAGSEFLFLVILFDIIIVVIIGILAARASSRLWLLLRLKDTGKSSVRFFMVK